MLPIPQPIADFIESQHVVGLACYANGELWGASCFYVADLARQRLIILTDSRTLHGQLMLENPHIAGTIAAQPREVKEIEGIQFQAYVTRLEGKEQAVALAEYIATFPIAEKMQSEVWEIAFQQIKYTSNRQIFGEKMYWQAVQNP